MTVHEFIFDPGIPKRYYRHVAFWATRLILQVLGGIIYFDNCLWDCLLNETRGKFYLILPEIAFTYLIVYYVIPKFLVTKKYFKFSIAVTALCAISFVFFSLFYLKSKDHHYHPTDTQLVVLWHFAMSFITDGPPVACILFLAIKMFKNHYKALDEKQMLDKENRDAELQLLKAQVHPHFLFNTLNNIYSFTLNKSEQAGVLVKKLTSVFRYMTDDCEQALVSLDKELKILQDYIGLEKVRYGNRISIQIKITGDPTGKMISPLLMIPFVENSFKHGTSQMLSESWINLEITITDDILNFSLRNSKPFQNKYSNGKNGIGLENVKKRLQLIYASEHTLTIDAVDNIFSVMMSVPLYENVKNEKIVVDSLNDFLTFEKSIPTI